MIRSLLLAAIRRTAFWTPPSALWETRGFEVPLRAITAEAGVNLAAVNYHFQSKDALLDAIIARRFAPVNRGRIEVLHQVEAEHPNGPLPLEQVLNAFFQPVFEAAAT